MAKKLTISCPKIGVNCNVRYENLANNGDKPTIIAKAGDGTIVRERDVVGGKVLEQGDRQRLWCDDTGKVYSKGELTFWDGDQQVLENEITKVFDITEFETLANYTDTFIMDKFYEVYPCDNGMKKDVDRTMARNANLFAMNTLWEYLRENNVVGRGHFVVSSRGFQDSDGYVRAVEVNGQRGLEIGLFKQRKAFQHLWKGKPEQVVAPQKAVTAKRVRMI
jgi:hypothetical protein